MASLRYYYYTCDLIESLSVDSATKRRYRARFNDIVYRGRVDVPTHSHVLKATYGDVYVADTVQLIALGIITRDYDYDIGKKCYWYSVSPESLETICQRFCKPTNDTLALINKHRGIGDVKFNRRRVTVDMMSEAAQLEIQSVRASLNVSPDCPVEFKKQLEIIVNICKTADMFTDNTIREGRHYTPWQNIPKKMRRFIRLGATRLGYVDISKCHFTAMCMVTKNLPLLNKLPRLVEVMNAMAMAHGWYDNETGQLIQAKKLLNLWLANECRVSYAADCPKKHGVQGLLKQGLRYCGLHDAIDGIEIFIEKTRYEKKMSNDPSVKKISHLAHRVLNAELELPVREAASKWLHMKGVQFLCVNDAIFCPEGFVDQLAAFISDFVSSTFGFSIGLSVSKGIGDEVKTNPSYSLAKDSLPLLSPPPSHYDSAYGKRSLQRAITKVAKRRYFHELQVSLWRSDQLAA